MYGHSSVMVLKMLQHCTNIPGTDSKQPRFSRTSKTIVSDVNRCGLPAHRRFKLTVRTQKRRFNYRTQVETVYIGRHSSTITVDKATCFCSLSFILASKQGRHQKGFNKCGISSTLVHQTTRLWTVNRFTHQRKWGSRQRHRAYTRIRHWNERLMLLWL